MWNIESAGTGDGTPVKGGTLALLGKGDVDHLDTALAQHLVLPWLTISVVTATT